MKLVKLTTVFFVCCTAVAKSTSEVFLGWLLVVEEELFDDVVLIRE